MKNRIYLKLSQVDGIGKKSLLLFRKYVNSNNTDIEKLDNTDIMNIYHQIKTLEKWIKVPYIDELKIADEKAEKIIENCKRSKVRIITIEDKDYPKEFNQIDSPPIIYFARGNHNALLYNKKIAIIGTRYPTYRGKKIAYDIAEYFTKRDYVIISGLAIGCDTFGHFGCIENKGQTVATLPSDVINIYPRENRDLAEKIIMNNGCIISEYPIGTKINDYMFIERDRLQAALSKVVIVIETEINGGTMHTVRFAKKYNKKIACLTYPYSLRGHTKIQGNKILLKESNVIKISELSDLVNIERFYD